MAYEKQEWADGPEGETPITADALNHIEDGIEAAAEAAGTAAAWGDVTGKPSTFPPAAHEHAWGEVTGKPATFPPAIGTTASTAKAGNWTPAIADVSGLEARLSDIEDRLDAIEAEASE